MLLREDMGVGNRGYTSRVGYMMIVSHMMCMSMQVVQFVVEESIVLGLYLDK